MQNSAINSSDDADVTEINVTPLADVTLVLLIILMLLSPMALQSMIQVQAAQAVATKSTAVEEKPLFVNVAKDGFTLNNRPLPSEYELFRALQRTLYGKHDKTVLISSDPDVRYQDVVRVLDLVRQSGAASLSLVPRKTQEAS